MNGKCMRPGCHEPATVEMTCGVHRQQTCKEHRYWGVVEVAARDAVDDTTARDEVLEEVHGVINGYIAEWTAKYEIASLSGNEHGQHVWGGRIEAAKIIGEKLRLNAMKSTPKPEDPLEGLACQACNVGEGCNAHIQPAVPEKPFSYVEWFKDQFGKTPERWHSDEKGPSPEFVILGLLYKLDAQRKA